MPIYVLVWKWKGESKVRSYASRKKSAIERRKNNLLSSKKMGFGVEYIKQRTIG